MVSATVVGGQHCALNVAGRQRTSERLLGDDDATASSIRRRGLHGFPVRPFQKYAVFPLFVRSAPLPAAVFSPEETPWRAAKTTRGLCCVYTSATPRTRCCVPRLCNREPCVQTTCDPPKSVGWPNARGAENSDSLNSHALTTRRLSRCFSSPLRAIRIVLTSVRVYSHEGVIRGWRRETEQPVQPFTAEMTSPSHGDVISADFSFV